MSSPVNQPVQQPVNQPAPQSIEELYQSLRAIHLDRARVRNELKQQLVELQKKLEHAEREFCTSYHKLSVAEEARYNKRISLLRRD